MSKHRVRHAFDRAAPTYDAAAELQRRVCERLAEGLDLATPTAVLDAGCGTGYGARLLARRWPSAGLVAADFAPAMLRAARLPTPICTDIESLPFADDSFDLYWSSLAVQWCDLGRAIAEAQRVLAAGGRIALSTLGSDTFREIDAAFAGVDAHRHTLAFHEPETVAAAFSAAGFRDITLHRLRLATHHPDLKSLLRAIKAIGANEVGSGRRGGLLGKHAWRTIEGRYERHREAAGLPANYDVILCYAQK